MNIYQKEKSKTLKKFWITIFSNGFDEVWLAETRNEVLKRFSTQYLGFSSYEVAVEDGQFDGSDIEIVEGDRDPAWY